MSDEPRIVFWGIMLGTHAPDGARKVPSLRTRKKLHDKFGCTLSLADWRKWAMGTDRRMPCGCDGTEKA